MCSQRVRWHRHLLYPKDASDCHRRQQSDTDTNSHANPDTYPNAAYSNTNADAQPGRQQPRDVPDRPGTE